MRNMRKKTLQRHMAVLLSMKKIAKQLKICSNHFSIEFGKNVKAFLIQLNVVAQSLNESDPAQVHVVQVFPLQDENPIYFTPRRLLLLLNGVAHGEISKLVDCRILYHILLVVVFLFCCQKFWKPSVGICC